MTTETSGPWQAKSEEDQIMAGFYVLALAQRFKARKEARREAIEECARAAEAVNYNGLSGSDIPRLHAMMIAAIRALAEQEAESA